MTAPERRIDVDRRPYQLLSVLMAVLVLAGACAADDAGVTEEADVVEDTEVTEDEPVAEGDPVSATTPARAQLDWVVATLNTDGQVTEEEIEEHFSADFLAEIPADQIMAVFPQLLTVADPPYTIERFEADDDGLYAEAVLIAAKDSRFPAEVSVSADPPHLIDSLFVSPLESVPAAPTDIDDLDDRLADLGSQSSLGVYDVTEGDCDAVHTIRADSPILLMSVFKLWVLAALAHEIDQGRAGWDETVPVVDELRSTPNGEIYELATGTEVTLQQLAVAMISISDNTATDMLLDRLGRETVEATVERIGVADPAANFPLLTTGNLFAIKYVADEPNSADYRALDEAARRSLLTDLDNDVLPWVGSGDSMAELMQTTNADGVLATEPRDFDIGWFATAHDLCRTLVHLDELARTPGLEPVASALEAEAQFGFDLERWPTIRFKGGSEPGVAAGAWWFEGSDGDRYVVAGGVADPDTTIDEIDAALTLASAIELID